MRGVLVGALDLVTLGTGPVLAQAALPGGAQEALAVGVGTGADKRTALGNELRTEPRVATKSPVLNINLNFTHFLFDVGTALAALEHRLELGGDADLGRQARKGLNAAPGVQRTQFTYAHARLFAQVIEVPPLLLRLDVHLRGGHEAALALKEELLTARLERLVDEFHGHDVPESFAVPALATGHAMRVFGRVERIFLDTGRADIECTVRARDPFVI